MPDARHHRSEALIGWGFRFEKGIFLRCFCRCEAGAKRLLILYAVDL